MLMLQINYEEFDFQQFSIDDLQLIENDCGYPPRFILWCTNVTNSSTSFTTTLSLQLKNKCNTDVEEYNFHFTTGMNLGSYVAI